jgi:hypothetical protein
MVRLVQTRYVYEESHASCVRNISTCSRCPMYHRIDSRRERDCHAHRDDLRGTIALPTFLLATLLCAVIHTVCGRCGRGSLLNGMIRVLARPKTIQRPGGTILHSNTTT